MDDRACTGHAVGTIGARALLLAALASVIMSVQLPDGDARAAGSAPRVYLGVWQPPGPWDMNQLATFERDAGKKAAIVHFYIGWAENSRPDRNLLEEVAGHGSVPMITWEPWDWKDPNGFNQPRYTLSSILSGTHDGYIRTWARDLASYRNPVLLRWAHEMNTASTDGTKYPWIVGVNGNTAQQYIDAWKHMRAIFAAEGATNIQWVWSPNVDWDGQHPFEPSFPGDAYVDWLGLDGYNNASWGGWKTFSQLFEASYLRITQLSAKPLMIAETASGESGGNKAVWITDALATHIPTRFPRVRALIWFNENYAADGIDYRIQSSAESRTAFADAVASPLYISTWR